MVQSCDHRATLIYSASDSGIREMGDNKSEIRMDRYYLKWLHRIGLPCDSSRAETSADGAFELAIGVSISSLHTRPSERGFHRFEMIAASKCTRDLRVQDQSSKNSRWHYGHVVRRCSRKFRVEVDVYIHYQYHAKSDL